MKVYPVLILFGILIFSASAQQVQTLNLQYHYDIRREFPTITTEFFGTDKLGYTFFFADLNFDDTVKNGGVSDVYFEFMRYFVLKRFGEKSLYFTVQYDDGTAPVNRIWLAGLNAGNLKIGPAVINTEFLLKQEFKMGLTWQYTIVWYMEMLNRRVIFNGFLDFWSNDTDDKDWPSFSPEARNSRYTLLAEPQLGYMITPKWKIGSELEISRGFLGSLTGELRKSREYRHDEWYFLPTVFIEYIF
ncbi:MAG: DUF5020 family protein [Calditrichia bacterium]